MVVKKRQLSRVASGEEEVVRSLYLELLKSCLTNFIYGDVEVLPFALKKKGVKRWLGRAFQTFGLELGAIKPFDPERRKQGYDIPPSAHSMIGLVRLNNLESCIRDVLENDVPGDFVETGVWRGGASIFMRAVLKSYQVTDRKVWVADSFEGLPRPNAEKYPADAKSRLYKRNALAISLDAVQSHFDRYGLLDDQVQFLKGWFKDTLPTAPFKTLAIARLDGDMYESTMDGLTSLYPKVSPGGYVIVDDYGAIRACRQAVQDYRDEHGITEEIVKIDYTGVYWKRSS